MLMDAPLDRFATEILGSFPESTQGNKYVLAVTNYFIKWVEIFAIPDQSVVTCAEVNLDKVIGHYCCPYEIHLDQGWNYKSIIFAKLCQLLKIWKMRKQPRPPLV